MNTNPGILRERIESLKDKHTSAEIVRITGATRQYVHEINGSAGRRRSPLLAVYRFIQEEVQEKHSAPSIHEIARKFPTDRGKPRSTSVVRNWLFQMERLKMIEPRFPGRPRGLALKPLNLKNPRIRQMVEEEKVGRDHGAR